VEFLLENPSCKECQPPDILLEFALRAEKGPKIRAFLCNLYAFVRRTASSWRVEREGFKAIRPLQVTVGWAPALFRVDRSRV
jgi:hypothetical protein